MFTNFLFSSFFHWYPGPGYPSIPFFFLKFPQHLTFISLEYLISKSGPTWSSSHASHLHATRRGSTSETTTRRIKPTSATDKTWAPSSVANSSSSSLIQSSLSVLPTLLPKSVLRELFGYCSKSWIILKGFRSATSTSFWVYFLWWQACLTIVLNKRKK